MAGDVRVVELGDQEQGQPGQDPWPSPEQLQHADPALISGAASSVSNSASSASYAYAYAHGQQQQHGVRMRHASHSNSERGPGPEGPPAAASPPYGQSSHAYGAWASTAPLQDAASTTALQAAGSVSAGPPLARARRGAAGAGAGGSSAAHSRAVQGLDSSSGVMLRVKIHWQQFWKEFAVHLLFPVTLPYVLFFQGYSALKQRHFWGLYWMTPAIWIFHATPVLAVFLYLFLLKPAERSAKSIEFYFFFGLLLIRTVMIAAKYGLRPPYLYRRSLQGRLPPEFCRSEELLFGWLPLAPKTARDEIEDACHRIRVDPTQLLYFKNSLQEVTTALGAAIHFSPEDEDAVQVVHAEPQQVVGVPFRLWLLQAMLDTSPEQRERYRREMEAAGRAEALPPMLRLSRRANSLLFASVDVLLRLVLTAWHVSLPYVISEEAGRQLWNTSGRMQLLSANMIVGGAMVMFNFIAPIMVTSVIATRRRYKWLRAVGEILCPERNVHEAELELAEQEEAAMEAALKERARHKRRRSDADDTAAGQVEPGAHAPGPRVPVKILKGEASDLSLDLKTPTNILAWAQLRRVASQVGWRFTLRLSFFTSIMALCLLGLMAVVLYSSVFTDKSIPQLFFLLTVIDVVFFGSCIVLAVLFGALSNNLAQEHRFLLVHLHLQLEHAPAISTGAPHGSGAGGSVHTVNVSSAALVHPRPEPEPAAGSVFGAQPPPAPHGYGQRPGGREVLTRRGSQHKVYPGPAMAQLSEDLEGGGLISNGDAELQGAAAGHGQMQLQRRGSGAGAGGPGASSSCCELCGQDLDFCSCARHLHLADAAVRADNKLMPESLVGVRMNFGLLRSVASLVLSACILTISQIRVHDRTEVGGLSLGGLVT